MSGSAPTILLQNHCPDLLTDALIEAIIPALQLQIDRDWFPHWNTRATIAGPNWAADSNFWPIALVNSSDEAGALGYHDLTAGKPMGIVAVGDCIRDKLNWNVTLSHEVLEMLGDPDITAVRQATIDGVTYDYAYESCDACEDDEYAYNVGGHMLSDFVFPAWFDPSNPPGPAYDFQRIIRRPLKLLPGGYIGRREIAPAAGDWSQVLAEEISARQVKGPTSRTIRRFKK